MRHIIVLILISFLIVGSAQGQITLTAANLDIPEYHDKLRRIVNNQILNYRTVVDYKDWEIPPRVEDAKPAETGRFVGIHGMNTWVSRVVGKSTEGKYTNNFAHIISPDDCYYLELKSAGQKNTLIKHATDWEDPTTFTSASRLFPACYQLFQPQHKQLKQVLEVADAEYEGRPSKRITMLTTYDAKWVVHLDRNTYQLLHGEADKVFDYKTRSYVAGKDIVRIEYRTDGGKLWPTRREIYTVNAKGKKQPVAEFNFVEYAPYTPTADELDMEKQFGIKPIPYGPRPDSAKPGASGTAGRSRLWLYAVAGVLATTAIGIVAVRRRKKA